jgi:predicted nucleic acid-binding protein
MATERNPYDTMAEEVGNVIAMPMEEEANATFEVDPSDGGVIVDFSEETIDMEASEDIAEWFGDMSELLEEDELNDIANDVIENYQSDKDSRAEWESMFESGFDLLGLKLEQGSEPFEGACTAVHPLLIESAVKFQSKASGELFPSSGPIKAQILGSSDTEKELQANRVQNFMNYQVTEQMPEYFDEFERMLFHLPIIGSAFKKLYYDATTKRPKSEFIPIDQFYVSYYATDLANADRYTHVIYRSPVEIARDINAGVYKPVDLPTPASSNITTFAEKMDTIIGLSPSSDNDPQYVLLEQHCYLDIEGEDIPLPYIVTVESQSRQILSIRRNYKQDDPNKEKIEHFVHYRFVPGFGFYGLGLIHFLGNLTMSATAAMRSLIDAGQFANLPGGFKAKGVRMVGDNEPIAPGEFKEVEATGIDLSKAIVPLPYKEPSSTLFQMLNFVATAGQKFADSTEQVISDAASYGPVGTTMALLEASSKFFSAIHKRLHKSQKDEFRILARIDYDYLPTEYPYDVPYEDRSIFKQDFDGRVDIIPVSDPNIPSNAHRMMMANMALQMAQQSPPGMFNLEELNRTILNAANMPNVDQILPPKIEPKPLDPVSDIMAATKGVPIAAFPGQNHDAHIQIKMAYLQDPMNGKNPIMQRIAPILQANIQEHSIMKYQEQMNGITEQMMQGVNPEEAQNPAVVEMVMAQAAQQILNANQAMGQAQSPEQQLVSLEQAKVELEKQKLESDTMVQAAEMELKTKKLKLEEADQIIDLLKTNATNSMKEEKAELDRDAKERLKELDIEGKLDLEDFKVTAENEREVARTIKDMLEARMKDDKDMEEKALEALTQLAVSQRENDYDD